MTCTHERLKELLHYDPATGVLTWRVRSRNTRVGDIAGRLLNGGYRSIGIDRRAYQAHRLAWLWMTGEWPKGDIDHIDGDPLNNRFENLRDVSHGINQQNQNRAHSNNKTGFLGVSPRGRKFRAVINVDGKHMHIGLFNTPELAYAAYLAAKRIHHEGNTL